ncbi:hypothetical protein [Pseudocitrobacter faecalis]|uniref:Conjugal transfer transcriptional regulator TraJ n=1 Tax=Salmonella enterica TaxID=28901 RepID=A0A5U3R622_SALER|nr:hypothetical protein [Salmonella enterica]EBP6409670.1 hypothetical protein [Salmonella enterica]EBP7111285.1 hypothetical protein [Salmonella enterica]
MSARDLMRYSDLSQSPQIHSCFEIFSQMEVPVCIRNSHGEFVFSNSLFSEYIKGSEYEASFWFGKLPFELQCAILNKELDAQANPQMTVIKSVIIDDTFHWYILFQVIKSESESFIVWSFVKDLVFSGGSLRSIENTKLKIKDSLNPALVLEPGVYKTFCLYFSGFSHEFIAKLLGVGVGTSKNRISKSYSLMGIYGRDSMIIYLQSNSYLHGIQMYAFELINAQFSKSNNIPNIYKA